MANKWYVTPWDVEYVNKEEDGDKPIWTCSHSSEDPGWETDCAQTGYGLTYAEAKELVDAANAVHNQTVDTSYLKPVPLNSIWQHYNNGKWYEVIGSGRMKNTLARAVIYRGYDPTGVGNAPRLDAEDEVFICPLSEWCGIVDLGNSNTVPRYRRSWYRK